jgi:hypothetical protein
VLCAVVCCCVVLDVVLSCVTLSSDMMWCVVGRCVVLCSDTGYHMVC